MTQTDFLRLQHIVVDGLFGTYNHDISLNLDDRVTLLHGPNGVGKTVVLGMISALLQGRVDYFDRIPFSRFLLLFQDGSRLELKPETIAANSDDRPYRLELMTVGTKHTATVSPSHRVTAIAARLDFLRPSGPNEWRDMRDGELLSASEILSRYRDLTVSAQDRESEDLGWFSDFLEHASIHSIEAERLLRMDPEAPLRHEYEFHGRPGSHPISISTVDKYSLDFRERLAKTMARYGRKSQALDQSFPQRLMEATENLEISNLQERMSRLDEKTASYKTLGILDQTPAHPSSVASLDKIDHTQVRVMTLYVQDTEQKLEVLEDLATRTRLLLENVNRKYRHKNIRLDREGGFVATSDDGQPLSLKSLSSGEQQELVLHYDLLFRVSSNTIVLIDEPELSLHVAWQKKFLPELLEIVQVSNFDALVATHSPFVVGDRTDLMIGLGDSA